METTTIGTEEQQFYYWKSAGVGQSAQLLTLFCRGCGAAADSDLPVISIMRDTLGDASRDNDRVTSIWLLTFSTPSFGQEVLSGIPFFYWRVGEGHTHASPKSLKPLMDLTTPQHPVVSGLARIMIQWLALDPMAVPLRATSRTYRINELDYERLHLEEAIRYLRRAPASDDYDALTADQINTVVARLELRKRILGGLVSEKRATRFGEQEQFRDETIRSRNWEVLRQCAEKTGLLFEPLDFSGERNEYAVLWFPVGEPKPRSGANVSRIWKILNVRDPWRDDRVQNWRGPVYTKTVNDAGALVTPEDGGGREIKVIPLGVYSLLYPKVPLLLIDFRDHLHIRGYEITQRSINEITSGLIGISHFTNWYYYVAADLYNFYRSRHGSATDQAERLDCYSQFRVALALDHRIDPSLRQEMERRVQNLSLNPLEAASRRELEAARERYALLVAQAETGGIVDKRLNELRRAEMASFGKTRKEEAGLMTLHFLSFGLYTNRVGDKELSLSALDAYRRVTRDDDLLKRLTENGTEPEVAYNVAGIRQAISELSELLSAMPSQEAKAQASATLRHVQELSADPQVQADCGEAVAAIAGPEKTRKVTIAAAVRSGIPVHSESSK